MQNILSHLPNTHFAGLNKGNSSFTFPQKISILKYIYTLLKWTVQLGVSFITRDFSFSSDKANGSSCSVPSSLCDDGRREALTAALEVHFSSVQDWYPKEETENRNKINQQQNSKVFL